jgi:DNA-binding transcriptional LysR family regulator
LRYVITAADSQSLNEAARKLFISQPSLSGAIHELEAEIGVEIFRRSSKGSSLTPQGEEFLIYARQITDQYHLMEERFIRQANIKKRFSVSMQHYSFAVRAFIELVRQFGMDDYEFAVYETKTAEVIENVRNFKSELGILYESEFNRRVIEKVLRENGLEFHKLFSCGVYVYLWKGHPLASREQIQMEELEAYPCLAFDQGANISFYLAEEMFSTYDYKKVIRANDRATMLNLMIGLNGYTLCSGIICEELNGSDYVAVPLQTQERMDIGYIVRKGMTVSAIGARYLDEIRKYQTYIL